MSVTTGPLVGLPPDTPQQRRIQELTIFNLCSLKSMLDLDAFSVFAALNAVELTMLLSSSSGRRNGWSEALSLMNEEIHWTSQYQADVD